MKYVVQIWGSNSSAPPHWMTVAYRGTMEAALAEMEWNIAHGIKPGDIRIRWNLKGEKQHGKD